MAKCLSLRQPYAELIVSGRKTIEIRKWNTRFRGEFLVDASKAIDKEVCKLYNIDICVLQVLLTKIHHKTKIQGESNLQRIV